MALKREEIDAWALGYIEAQETFDRDSGEDLPWAIDRFMSIGDGLDPDDAWRTILAILARRPSEDVTGALAAGPLEDLIEDHGDAFIERIEAEARADPAFRQVLCGVWPSNIPEIWERIETARGMKAASFRGILVLSSIPPLEARFRGADHILTSIQEELDDALRASAYVEKSEFRLVNLILRIGRQDCFGLEAGEARIRGMVLTISVQLDGARLQALSEPELRTELRAVIIDILREAAARWGLPSGVLDRMRGGGREVARGPVPEQMSR